MILPNPTKEPEQELYSINDLLKAWKQHYNGKAKILYVLHMIVLIPFAVIRYLLIAPVIKYFKDLWADQNGSPFRNK